MRANGNITQPGCQARKRVPLNRIRNCVGREQHVANKAEHRQMHQRIRCPVCGKSRLLVRTREHQLPRRQRKSAQQKLPEEEPSVVPLETLLTHNWATSRTPPWTPGGCCRIALPATKNATYSYGEGLTRMDASCGSVTHEMASASVVERSSPSGFAGPYPATVARFSTPPLSRSACVGWEGIADFTCHM